MRIDIQSTDLKLGQSFKQKLKVKIRKLFEHHSQHIQEVSVILRDVNGPKGGEDKLCKVNVFAGKGRHVLVSVTAASAIKAATLAIRKASNSLQKQFRKSRTIEHTSLARVMQSA